MTSLKILSAVVAVGALGLVAAPAGAQDVKQETVKIHTADLRTASGRDGVMILLRHVARRVCHTDADLRDLRVSADVFACEKKSFGDAVRDINDPELARAAHQNLSTPVVEVAEAAKSQP